MLPVHSPLGPCALGTHAVPRLLESLFESPRHPYTKALLSSMPSMDPDRRTLVAPLAGDPPNPIDPPSGCRFHPRCERASAACSASRPPIEGERQIVRCFHPLPAVPRESA